MATTFHDQLVSVYKVIEDLTPPCRPENTVYPHTLNPDFSSFPYLQVHYLGNQPNALSISGTASTVSLLFQIDIVTQAKGGHSELNGLAQAIKDAFKIGTSIGPENALEQDKLIVNQAPRTSLYGIDPDNTTTMREVLTISLIGAIN